MGNVSNLIPVGCNEIKRDENGKIWYNGVMIVAFLQLMGIII